MRLPRSQPDKPPAAITRLVTVTVIVDAENVRRATWPNLAAGELVARCGTWARTSGVRAIVVFDGRAPDAPTVEGCTVVSSGDRSADDRIVELVGSGPPPLWLVTSDRELRARVGSRAQLVLGGGAFVRDLLRL